jgi:uncharacterized protein (DUF362 family)
LKKVQLPNVLLHPSFFISLANAKTHSLTQITGAMKNQFGCLPEKEKHLYHRGIDRVLLDINRLVKSNLCIIDARFGLEGVLRGRKRDIGVILCGQDPVAVDVILAQIMGFVPSKINHLTFAVKHGLGCLDPIVIGEKVEAVQVKFRKEMNLFTSLGKYVPKSILPIARRLYSHLK